MEILADGRVLQLLCHQPEISGPVSWPHVFKRCEECTEEPVWVLLWIWKGFQAQHFLAHGGMPKGGQRPSRSGKAVNVIKLKLFDSDPRDKRTWWEESATLKRTCLIRRAEKTLAQKDVVRDRKGLLRRWNRRKSAAKGKETGAPGWSGGRGRSKYQHCWWKQLRICYGGVVLETEDENARWWYSWREYFHEAKNTGKRVRKHEHWLTLFFSRLSGSFQSLSSVSPGDSTMSCCLSLHWDTKFCLQQLRTLKRYGWKKHVNSHLPALGAFLKCVMPYRP